MHCVELPQVQNMPQPHGILFTLEQNVGHVNQGTLTETEQEQFQLNYGIISSLNESLTFGTAWITGQFHRNH